MAGPHDRAREYLLEAIRGNKQPYSKVKGDAADIRKNQRGGSGNWPIQIAVGAAINDDPSGQDLGPFLRGENGWGLNGNEHGSAIYETWNAASIVALIHKAKRYRAGKERAEATRWLRAEIAKYCLGLKLIRPKRSVLFVEGEGTFKPSAPAQWKLQVVKPDGWSYPTDTQYGPRLYPVMPGSRQIERFNRNHPAFPQEHTANLDRNMMAPFVAWALGVQRSFPSEKDGIRTPTGWGWPIWMLEQVLGRKFHEKAEPSMFGLTRDEADTLRRFLDGRRDPAPLLEYLAGYGTTEGQECHWIQLESGDVAAWVNKTIHSSTTGCPLVWTAGDQVFWVSPQSTQRSAKQPARCERDGDDFVVRAEGTKLVKSPVTRRFRPFKQADPLWEVVWDANGFRTAGAAPGGGGGQRPQQPQPQKPQPQQPQPQQPQPQQPQTPTGGAAAPAQAIELAKSIPGLADQVDVASTAEKTALRRIRNRADEIVRLLGVGTAAARRQAIELAKTMPPLTDAPKPASAAGRTALQRIRNRVDEIVRLLS